MADRPAGGNDELSRSLRALREAADLRTRDVAELTGFSQAKVSRVERGINVPTESDVDALARAYRAPDETRRHLVSLARDLRAERRPVVMVRGKGAPSAFQERLVRIEAASEHISTFTPTVVPGLLQTQTYMREVVAHRHLPTVEVDRFVAQRLARQERLRDPTYRFTQITTAGALGWRAGTPIDMAAQVDHICAVSHRPNVKVGVIPWGARAHLFPLHGWDLHDERAVIYGTADATAVLTEPNDVARYVELFEGLAAMAVYGDEVRALLQDLAERYRRMPD